MSEQQFSLLIQAVGGALAALAFGLAYFHALGLSVSLLLQPGRRGLGVALTLARLAAAALLLYLAARIGVAALLGSLAGFLAARMIALRRQKKEVEPS